MNLRDLGAVRKRLTVARYAGPIGIDHHGIGKDDSDRLVTITDGDDLPAFVSPELREREPAGHFHGVLILRGNGSAPRDGEHYCNDHHQRNWYFRHGHSCGASDWMLFEREPVLIADFTPAVKRPQLTEQSPLDPTPCDAAFARRPHTQRAVPIPRYDAAGCDPAPGPARGGAKFEKPRLKALSDLKHRLEEANGYIDLCLR